MNNRRFGAQRLGADPVIKAMAELYLACKLKKMVAEEGLEPPTRGL
jgi:hypothetical protein